MLYCSIIYYNKRERFIKHQVAFIFIYLNSTKFTLWGTVLRPQWKHSVRTAVKTIWHDVY